MNSAARLAIATVVMLALAACAAPAGASTTPAAAAAAAPTTAAAAASASGFGTGASQALAGAGGADAANLITGTIASTAPGYITVNTQRGPLRLAVDDAVQANRVVAASLADLAVDDDVAVTGERAADGTMTARSISLNPEFPAAGTSTDSQAGATRGEFLQREGDGGGNTRFFGGPGGQGAPGGAAAGPGGQLSPEQADQLVQQAVASGRISADQAAAFRERLLAGDGRPGALGTARIGPGGGGTGGGESGAPQAGASRLAVARLFGRIAEVQGDRLAIDSNNGRVTVLITPTTAIQRVERVPASELPVGTTVSVTAARGSDGVVRATSVIVGEPGGLAPGFGGPVRP